MFNERNLAAEVRSGLKDQRTFSQKLADYLKNHCKEITGALMTMNGNYNASAMRNILEK